MVVWWMLAAMASAQSGFTGVGGPDRAPGLRPQAEDDDVGNVAELLRRQDELLEAVGRYDPGLRDRLLGLRQTDRPAYVAALVRIARHLQRARRDPAFRARVQRMRELTSQMESLARGFPDVPERERAARRAQLEALAGELMDLKQADRRERLAALRAKLAGLQAEIERRDQDRDQIIEDFVDQLLQPPVDL